MKRLSKRFQLRIAIKLYPKALSAEKDHLPLLNLVQVVQDREYRRLVTDSRRKMKKISIMYP